jgi:transposase
MQISRETTKQSGHEIEVEGLPVVRPNVAGMDLGSTQHWVCAPKKEEPGREVEHFGATTPELEKMAEWLKERNVESVAMESTGVYWIPPHEILERHGLEVVLVNTRELARVPGRKKTDRVDCKWIGHKRYGMVSLSWTRLTVGAAPVVKVAQLRAADRLVPAQRTGVHAAHLGAG